MPRKEHSWKEVIHVKTDEEKRAYAKAYYASHKDYFAHYARERRARIYADPALHEDLKRKWREDAKRYYRRKRKELTPEQKERHRERNRAYYAKRRKDPTLMKKRRERSRERYYSEGGKEWSSIYHAEQYRKLRARLESDPVAYAAYRRKARERKERARGPKYVPRQSRRIPDWATMGQAVLDRRSVFLIQNMSAEMQASVKGFARAQAIERKTTGFRY